MGKLLYIFMTLHTVHPARTKFINVMYFAKRRLLPAKHHKLHRNVYKGGRSKAEQERESESDPNNADPEQVRKVNPNPECKHQITLQHTIYGISIHSFIGLSLN